MTDYSGIADRFARETAAHQTTILHDEELYRHLHFENPKRSMYWFDLITAPGVLLFQGDGDSYVFRRLPDMFEFFRSSAWKGAPNVGYWAEKLTSGRDSILKYDADLLEQHVNEAVAEATQGGELGGLEAAVQAEVLDEFVSDESIDRKLVDDFAYWERFTCPVKEPDFVFRDTFEWECCAYDWWFLWACHAIVWGIAQYDRATKPIMDVHLPGDAA